MTIKNVLIIIVLILASHSVLVALVSAVQQFSNRGNATSFIDLVTPALLFILFTGLGIIKFIGQKRGSVGGGGKPLLQRLTAGYCPTWSRPVILTVP